MTRRPSMPDPATVLRIQPSESERRAFNELDAVREWDGILSIADVDDREDALRLFCWFRRRVDAISGASR